MVAGHAFIPHERLGLIRRSENLTEHVFGCLKSSVVTSDVHAAPERILLGARRDDSGGLAGRGSPDPSGLLDQLNFTLF